LRHQRAQRPPSRKHRGNTDAPTNRVYRIAVIPGDGIGKEVVPEGVRALQAVAKKFSFELRLDHFDFACKRPPARAAVLRFA
jgi:isocitrate/isopropylmalate dehydrogenase